MNTEMVNGLHNVEINTISPLTLHLLNTLDDGSNNCFVCMFRYKKFKKTGDSLFLILYIKLHWVKTERKRWEIHFVLNNFGFKGMMYIIRVYKII